MNFLVGKHSWLVSVVAFAVCCSLLLLTWGVMAPADLVAAFDADGKSPFELMTLPIFAAVIPMIWIRCPFKGSWKRKTLMCLVVTVLISMALIKEEDIHLAVFNALYGDPGQYLLSNGNAFTGTPYKLKFLTKCSAPFGAKMLVLGYFTVLLGIGTGAIARYVVPFWKGVFRLHPVAWSIGAMGGSGVMVMICDRLPAYLKHGGAPIDPNGSTAALLKAFEEGGEMMIPILAILAILQAHAIYNADVPDPKWSEL